MIHVKSWVIVWNPTSIANFSILFTCLLSLGVRKILIHYASMSSYDMNASQARMALLELLGGLEPPQDFIELPVGNQIFEDFYALSPQLQTTLTHCKPLLRVCSASEFLTSLTADTLVVSDPQNFSLAPPMVMSRIFSMPRDLFIILQLSWMQILHVTMNQEGILFQSKAEFVLRKKEWESAIKQGVSVEMFSFQHQLSTFCVTEIFYSGKIFFILGINVVFLIREPAKDVQRITYFTSSTISFLLVSNYNICITNIYL